MGEVVKIWWFGDVKIKNGGFEILKGKGGLEVVEMGGRGRIWWIMGGGKDDDGGNLGNEKLKGINARSGVVLLVLCSSMHSYNHPCI